MEFKRSTISWDNHIKSQFVQMFLFTVQHYSGCQDSCTSEALTSRFRSAFQRCYPIFFFFFFCQLTPPPRYASHSTFLTLFWACRKPRDISPNEALDAAQATQCTCSSAIPPDFLFPIQKLILLSFLKQDNCSISSCPVMLDPFWTCGQNFWTCVEHMLFMQIVPD